MRNDELLKKRAAELNNVDHVTTIRESLGSHLVAYKPVNEGLSGPRVGIELEVVTARFHCARLDEQRLHLL